MIVCLPPCFGSWEGSWLALFLQCYMYVFGFIYALFAFCTVCVQDLFGCRVCLVAVIF